LKDSEQFWTDWSGRCTYTGEYRDAVMRSLITLKALTYAPTGGIVAAPTTSLPETLGGERNWDYRYCWLRDATITLDALLRGSFVEEAAQWRTWLLRTVAGSPQDLQIMYGVAGERRLQEWQADWLPGYENSVPVRVGNAAAGQLQLDVYGAVMDSIHLAVESGTKLNECSAALVVALLDTLAKRWREPDEGLWEVRGPRRHFVHSKVMAWVAFDRAVRMAERHGQPGPVEQWRKIRDDIHAEVLAKGYDPQRNTFTQYYGSTGLDASLLLIPAVGFLPPSDPRVIGTIDAVQRELMVDGFVLRYHTDADSTREVDGLVGIEGAFLACSFWLADALRILGREHESHELFERLLALRNDLGLLAEEYDPRARRQVGNFPQAFSHVPLIKLAFDFSRHRGTSPRISEAEIGGPR
jgi:GH15 family glucan-1,4-alpha-glucosidase